MTTVAATEKLIKPHGGRLVERTGERPESVDSLEVVTLTSREVSDLDLIACGALSPLERAAVGIAGLPGGRRGAPG